MATLFRGEKRVNEFGADWWKRLRVLLLGLVCVSVVLVGVGIAGLNVIGSAASRQSERVVCLQHLARIGHLLEENRTQLGEALQHEPGTPLFTRHHHPLERHVQALLKSREEIGSRWLALEQSSTDKSLMAATGWFAGEKEHYLESIDAALMSVTSGDFGTAREIVAQRLDPSERDARMVIHDLEMRLSTATLSGLELLTGTVPLGMAWVGLAVAFWLISVVGVIFLAVRLTVRPLTEIAELTDEMIRRTDAALVATEINGGKTPQPPSVTDGRDSPAAPAPGLRLVKRPTGGFPVRGK